MERLKLREQQRYGDKISIGGPLYDPYMVFMDWASNYDTGNMDIRSKMLHEAWIQNLPCKVLRIEEDIGPEEKIKLIGDMINV